MNKLPALNQQRVRASEIERSRLFFRALSLQFRTADREASAEIHTGHDVRHRYG